MIRDGHTKAGWLRCVYALLMGGVAGAVGCWAVIAIVSESGWAPSSAQVTPSPPSFRDAAAMGRDDLNLESLLRRFDMLRSAPPTPAARRETEAVLRQILRLEPQRVIELAAEGKLAIEYKGLFESALRRLAGEEEDPLGALSADVRTLPRGWQRVAALGVLAQITAERGKLDALRAGSAAFPEDQREFRRMFVGTWLADEANDLSELTQQLSPWEKARWMAPHPRVQEQILMDPARAEEALAAQGLGPGSLGRAISLTIDNLTPDQMGELPADRLESLRTLAWKTGVGPWFDFRRFEAATREDPLKGLETVSGLEPGLQREAYLKLARTAFEISPETGARVATKIPSRYIRSDAFASAAAKLAAERPPHALDWALSLGDPVAAAAATGSVLLTWGAADFPAAAHAALDAPSMPAERNSLEAFVKLGSTAQNAESQRLAQEVAKKWHLSPVSPP